jgi:hypothetical protein
MENLVPDAIAIIVKHLQDDKSYYIAWQANIAMAFQDEMHRKGYRLPDLYEIANKAADNFLELLMAKNENLIQK